jgi:Zn-dependent protease
MWWLSAFNEFGPIGGLILVAFEFGVLALCISVHEFAHAYTADRLGDPTARSMGRLTLNPLAHLDPMGSILLVLFGFGWGKPVMFNPAHFANPRRDASLVAFAGPASNLAFAALFSVIFHFVPLDIVKAICSALVTMNLVLCFFNLIPVNPLDGFKVVWGLLPHDLAYQWMELAPYGIYILLFLILTNATSVLISGPIAFFTRILL